MAKQHDVRALARLARRPSGESDLGVVVDPITVGPNQTINVDLAKLPAPDRIYDADLAWIEHQGRAVSLFFAKRLRNSPQRLRTRLELRYSPEHLVVHFWQNSRGFHERLRSYAAKWPPDDAREEIDPAKMDAEHEHSEWTNFEAMAHVGSEACLDFYLLPAVGVARFARGQGSSGLRLTPIVRVQLTIFELLRLLDSAESVVNEVKAYLPKLEGATEELQKEGIEESL